MIFLPLQLTNCLSCDASFGGIDDIERNSTSMYINIKKQEYSKYILDFQKTFKVLKRETKNSQKFSTDGCIFNASFFPVK